MSSVRMVMTKPSYSEGKPQICLEEQNDRLMLGVEEEQREAILFETSYGIFDTQRGTCTEDKVGRSKLPSLSGKRRSCIVYRRLVWLLPLTGS
jgi:hypothetical protein